MKINKITSIIILTIIFCFFLTSCSGKKSEKSDSGPNSSQSQESSQKVPEQLIGIDENIEKIIMELGGLSTLKEAISSGKGQGQSQGQSQSQSQGQGQSQGQSQSQSQGQGQSQGQNQQSQGQGQSQGQNAGEQKQDEWSKIDPLIIQLNYQWNDYLPNVSKDGANKGVIENFSNSLNNLTTVIESKNKNNALIASNNLYGIIPEIFSIYKSKDNIPELKRVKYYIRDSVINSMNNNWDQANSSLNQIKSSWSISKNLMSENQQELQSKLDYSIYELEKVIKEKNQKLAELKGKIAISNIAEIEKNLKSNSSSQSSMSSKGSNTK